MRAKIRSWKHRPTMGGTACWRTRNRSPSWQMRSSSRQIISRYLRCPVGSRSWKGALRVITTSHHCQAKWKSSPTRGNRTTETSTTTPNLPHHRWPRLARRSPWESKKASTPSTAAARALSKQTSTTKPIRSWACSRPRWTATPTATHPLRPEHWAIRAVSPRFHCTCWSRTNDEIGLDVEALDRINYKYEITLKL